jgi:hypothetical protein
MARNRLNEGEQAAPTDAVETPTAPEAPGSAPAADGAQGGDPIVEPPPAPEVAEPVEAKPKRYVVAPGASLVGARGKLGPGEPVLDGEFSSDQLQAFVAAGALVEA